MLFQALPYVLTLIAVAGVSGVRFRLQQWVAPTRSPEGNARSVVRRSRRARPRHAAGGDRRDAVLELVRLLHAGFAIRSPSRRDCGRRPRPEGARSRRATLGREAREGRDGGARSASSASASPPRRRSPLRSTASYERSTSGIRSERAARPARSSTAPLASAADVSPSRLHCRPRVRDRLKPSRGPHAPGPRLHRDGVPDQGAGEVSARARGGAVRPASRPHVHQGLPAYLRGLARAWTASSTSTSTTRATSPARRSVHCGRAAFRPRPAPAPASRVAARGDRGDRDVLLTALVIAAWKFGDPAEPKVQGVNVPAADRGDGGAGRLRHGGAGRVVHGGAGRHPARASRSTAARSSAGRRSGSRRRS